MPGRGIPFPCKAVYAMHGADFRTLRLAAGASHIL